MTSTTLPVDHLSGGTLSSRMITTVPTPSLGLLEVIHFHFVLTWPTTHNCCVNCTTRRHLDNRLVRTSLSSRSGSEGNASPIRKVRTDKSEGCEDKGVKVHEFKIASTRINIVFNSSKVCEVLPSVRYK